MGKSEILNLRSENALLLQIVKQKQISVGSMDLLIMPNNFESTV